MRDKFKFRLFSIFSIILLCIGLTVKSFQNDTFYLIKLGESIIKNGVDLVDHYCWVANLNYTYPHWLYDVFIYLIYSNFNYLGIYVSTMIFFIILIITIYFVNLKINNNDFMALIVSILSIFYLHLFATARAQLISYILLLLEVYFIEKLINCGKKKYILFLAILSLILANVHATIWLVYFIFFLPYIGEYLIYKFMNSKFIDKVRNKNIKFRLKCSTNKLLIDNISNIKLVFLSFVLSFFMGILSPSKICYTYVFKIMMGDSQTYITEHAPLVVSQVPLFMALMLLVFLILSFTTTKIKLRELFMIFGLGFMVLSSGRHLALFIIIGMLFISKLCCRFFDEEGDKSFDILYKIISRNNFIYISLMVVVILFSGYQLYNNYKKEYVSYKEYPVKAVRYIKNNIDYKNIKLYNSYNFGSYLLFNDIPVFIDSRCDLYFRQFNGKKLDIFDDDIEISYKYRYEKYFNKYNVSHVLISNKGLLSKILNKDNNYKKIYKDKNYVLFERLDYSEN